MTTRYIDIHAPISNEGLVDGEARMVEHGGFVVADLLRLVPKSTKDTFDRWKRLRQEFDSKKYPGQFEVLQDDLPVLFAAYQQWAQNVPPDAEWRFCPFHEAHLNHTGERKTPTPPEEPERAEAN